MGLENYRIAKLWNLRTIELWSDTTKELINYRTVDL